MSLVRYLEGTTEQDTVSRTVDFRSLLKGVGSATLAVSDALLDLVSALLRVIVEAVRQLVRWTTTIVGGETSAVFAAGFGVGYSCSVLRYWLLTRGPLVISELISH